MDDPYEGFQKFPCTPISIISHYLLIVNELCGDNNILLSSFYVLNICAFFFSLEL